MRRCAQALTLLSLLLLALPASAAPKKVLFDNTKGETAGNADWIIDTDQPLPLPDQSTVTAATPRTYWLGAISSYGIDLVKRGYQVATLTTTYGITYGNASNAYDLSKYDVFVVPEPNILFTAAEATAILDFVRNGGGLVAIADHDNSDRNGDGIDSPEVWNAMDPTHLLGVHFQSTGETNNNIVQDSGNHATAPSDSIIFGPYGVADSLSFHNGTTFTLYPAVNPTVRGEVWMKGLAQTSLTGVMAASSVYGNGRVFFIGDSSPVDDGSAQPGNSSIFDGWGEAAGRDSLLFLNATAWVARRDAPAADTQAPVVNLSSPDGGEVWKAGSSQVIAWSATDNTAVSSVDIDWSSTGAAPWTSLVSAGANSGTYNWTVPDSPTNAAKVRVRARDAAGNLGSDSSSTAFVIDRWIITASAGAGGTLSPSGSVGVVQGGTQAFTIAANVGQHITGVLVDGAPVGAVTGYAFSNVTGAHTIAATFAPDAFTLTAAAVGAGAVAKSPDLATYTYGTPVLVTATPDSGWAFTGWSGDASGTADTATVVITVARSVTATFVDVAPPAVALLSPVGGERWDFGAARTLRWTAADNAAVDSVVVEYSAHGAGGPWTTLLASGTVVDSLDWTVPAEATDSALVRVTAFDAALNSATAASDSLFHVLDPNAGVDDAPHALSFARPSPNPARGAVRFAFALPAEASVTVDVLDVSGRRIATLAHGTFPAGTHELRWSGHDATGALAHPGVYFARLTTPTRTFTQRFVRMD
jgi:hypothetical protein